MKDVLEDQFFQFCHSKSQGGIFKWQILIEFTAELTSNLPRMVMSELSAALCMMSINDPFHITILQ
jgi:hypothetical protein